MFIHLCYKKRRKYPIVSGGLMEEKRLVERFNDVFVKTAPILENVKKGFFAQKIETIQENRVAFRELLLSRVAFVEQIVGAKEKTEVERYYITLLPIFQRIALAMENLISKMETKVEMKILFSEKALAEIRELYGIMEIQFRDTKDYITTKNPVLKANIQDAWEKVYRLIDEYAMIHQDRLIAGLCMPKASYLYLDMIDSIKRISRELFDFSEKA